MHSYYSSNNELYLLLRSQIIGVCAIGIFTIVPNFTTTQLCVTNVLKLSLR